MKGSLFQNFPSRLHPRCPSEVPVSHLAPPQTLALLSVVGGTSCQRSSESHTYTPAPYPWALFIPPSGSLVTQDCSHCPARGHPEAHWALEQRGCSPSPQTHLSRARRVAVPLSLRQCLQQAWASPAPGLASSATWTKKGDPHNPSQQQGKAEGAS